MSAPYYQDDLVTVLHGDCLDVLRELPDNSVDAVVTDPPYGLEFMGKEWDKFGRDTGNGYREKPRMTDDHMGKGFKQLPNHFEAGRPFQRWCQQWAVECLRVLKPGGHMLSFGGTRTFHRLGCAVEDAGFELRPALAWIFGQGFPKSLNVQKSIDTKFCREAGTHTADEDHVCPLTPEGERWAGFGTDTKPAFEPIVVARKPLSGTVAATVLEWGTGALNVDGCRIAGEAVAAHRGTANARVAMGDGWGEGYQVGDAAVTPPNTAGRWPANVVLDEAAAEVLDQQSGEQRDGVATNRNRSAEELASDAGWGYRKQTKDFGFGSAGGASRFFYTAKAGSDERITYTKPGEGADNATSYGRMKTRQCRACGSRAKAAGGDQSGRPWPTCGHEAWEWVEQQSAGTNVTSHPTVKPLALMRWLVRLITPPGGLILEPFAGSGTTVEAALLEGFRCVAIEREADYLPLIMSRIRRASDPADAVAIRQATPWIDDDDLFSNLETA